MMRLFKSFRSKLLLVYFVTVLVSAVILECITTIYLSGWISSQINSLTQDTSAAICQNIDTYLDDLDRISILPYMNDDLLAAFEIYTNKEVHPYSDYEVCEAMQTIDTSFMLSLDTNRAEVNSILIIYPDGKADYFDRYSGMSVKDGFDYKNEAWYSSILAAGGRSVFIDSHQEDYLDEKKDTPVFSIARLIKNPNTQKSIAIVVCNINNSALNQILDDNDFGASSVAVIQNQNGSLVYSPQDVSADLQNQIYRNKGIVTEGKYKYVKISRHIDNTNWIFNVLVPYSQTQKRIDIVNVTIGAFIFIQILIASILFSFWSRTITGRFSQIRNVMRVAKGGDLAVRYHAAGNDEISAVGHDLNDMIAKIGNLMEKERKAVSSMKDAEYRALQSQINPHFIYNTLNGFIGLNRLGMRDTLESAILSLSGLMRYALEHKEYATLEEEFRFIEKYCILQKIRFKDRMDVRISLDEDVKNVKIPKLLLQPLVENAILHGLEPLQRMGTLSVSAKKETAGSRTFIRISVDDDGCGFDLGKLSEAKSVGLKNVQERLKLAYPKAIFEMASKVGSGTQMAITVEKAEESPS